MLKKLLVVISAVILAGCASPREWKTEPENYKFESTKKPYDVAVCISDFISDERPSLFFVPIKNGSRMVALVPDSNKHIGLIEVTNTASGGSQTKFWYKSPKFISNLPESSATIIVEEIQKCL